MMPSRCGSSIDERLASDVLSLEHQSKSPKYVNSLVFLILHLTYYLFGFPSHTNEMVQSQILKTYVLKNELDIYLKYTSKLEVRQFVLPTFGMILIVKHLFYFEYVITTLSIFRKTRLNISKAAQTNIGCISTNCTSKEELYALPIFSLCKPHLRQFYTPLIDLHNFGILFLSLVTCFVLLIGVILILYTHFVPRSSETFMFAVCPISVRNSNRYCVKKYLVDAYESLINYCNIKANQIRFSHIARTGELNSELKVKAQIEQLSATISMGIDRSSELRNDYYKLDCTMTDFVDDCITLVRSYIWNSVLKSRFVITTILLFTVILCAFIGTLYLFWIMMLLSRLKFRLLSESFRNKNCLIWLTNSAPSINVLDVDEVEPKWYLVGLFDVLIVLVPVGVISTLNIAGFYINVDDINCHIKDVIARTRVMINLTDVFILVERHELKDSKTHLSINRKANYSFEPVRKLLYKQFTNQETGKLVSTKLNHISYEVIESEGINMDSYCDMLTKIYVSIRLVMDQFKTDSRVMCEVLIFISVFNFVSISLMLFYNKLFEETSFLPISIVATLVTTNSALIIQASALQTRSRTLMLLIWRLIALTSDMKHIRVRHMRSLLIKQLELLARSDGLKLAAYGISITKSTIIKLVLWSSTLIVISFGSKV